MTTELWLPLVKIAVFLLVWLPLWIGARNTAKGKTHYYIRKLHP